MEIFYKLTFKLIASAIVGFIMYVSFQNHYFKHNFVRIKFDTYSWMFMDTAQVDLDKYFCISEMSMNDTTTRYYYKRRYLIDFWVFNELQNMDSKQIGIKENVPILPNQFESNEILGYKTDRPIKIRYGFRFNGEMNVELDEASKILKRYDTPTYRGFYGKINMMSFSNGRGESQILYESEGEPNDMILLLYKARGRQYIILVQSNEKPFDENIINILNLQ